MSIQKTTIKHHHTPQWQNSSYFASFTTHWNLYIIYGKLDFLCRQSLHIFDTIEEENSAENNKTSLSILAKIRKSIRGASKKETNLPAQAHKYEVMAELIGDTSELSERIFNRVKQYLDDQNVGDVNKHGDNIEKLKKDLEDLENFINQSFPTTLPKALFDAFKVSSTILGIFGILSLGASLIGSVLIAPPPLPPAGIAMGHVLASIGGPALLVTLALLAIIGAAYWVAINRQEICPALKTADDVNVLKSDKVFQRLMGKYPAPPPVPKKTAEQENTLSKQPSEIKLIQDAPPPLIQNAKPFFPEQDSENLHTNEHPLKPTDSSQTLNSK